jgi:hypothetical protein
MSCAVLLTLPFNVIFWSFLIDKSRHLDSFAADAMGEISCGPMDCAMIIIGESKTTPDNISKPESAKPFISYEDIRLIDVPARLFGKFDGSGISGSTGRGRSQALESKVRFADDTSGTRKE